MFNYSVLCCFILLTSIWISLVSSKENDDDNFWVEWFMEMYYQDWHYWNNNWDYILNQQNANDQHKQEVIEKWHDVCSPYLKYCQHDYDCNYYVEKCVNYQCLSTADEPYYNTSCSTDINCSQGLVCCEGEKGSSQMRRCCHKSERDHYEELPCRDNDDCCKDNKMSYCCSWISGGGLYGTCCTYEQYNKFEYGCYKNSCGDRMKCCPGDNFRNGHPNYCCSGGEYKLLTNGGDSCQSSRDCVSGYCCSNKKCCTYEEYQKDGAYCYTDSECFFNQDCCSSTDKITGTHCCYKDDDETEALFGLSMLIIGSFLTFACIILLVICVKCCAKMKKNKNNSEKISEKAQKKNKRQSRVGQAPPSPPRNTHQDEQHMHPQHMNYYNNTMHINNNAQYPPHGNQPYQQYPPPGNQHSVNQQYPAGSTATLPYPHQGNPHLTGMQYNNYPVASNPNTEPTAPPPPPFEPPNNLYGQLAPPTPHVGTLPAAPYYETPRYA